MRRELFLIGIVAAFSLFSVLDAYAQTAPDEPENFAADDVSSTKIILQWDEPDDDGGSAVTGYKISYRIHPATDYTVLENFTSSTVYEHENRPKDKIHIYRIWAYNAYGISDYVEAVATPSDSSAPPENIVPNAPSGLTATDTSPTSISLSWNKPASNNGPPVDGYKIEVKIGSGSFSILVADTASTIRAYTHTGLTTGTEYTYKVYALNSVGQSVSSNEDSATPISSSAPPEGSDVPSSPKNFKATAASDSEIGLSWEPPGTFDGPAVSGYKIEFKKTGDQKFSDLVTTGAVTNYLHTGLTAGTTYSYKISAINSVGASNTVAASAVPEHTEVPTNFIATAVSPTSIVLSWNAPSQTYGFNIVGYIIERELAPGVYETQTETSGSNTSVTLTGLQTDKTYTYIVSAKFSIGKSPPSEEASATPTTSSGPSELPPDPPLSLTITNASPTSNTLSWSAPADDGGKPITGYKIDVQVDGGSWETVKANTGTTSTTYSHTNIPSGTDFSYRVAAINSVGTGLHNSRSITIEGGSEAPKQVIKISADKSSYFEGDTIAISGNVESKTNGEQVSLQVILQNDLIAVDQVEVAQDGTFSDTIVASGINWKLNGIYTAKATYANSTGQTNFQFTKTTSSTPDPKPVPDPEPQVKKAPSFIDTTVDAQYYIDRYDNEPAYKAWFDANYPDYTFDEAIALAYPEPDPEPDPEPVPDPEPKSEPKPILDFVDPKQDPQYYIDRYNNEPTYKAWFDKNYPDYTIEEAVGIAMPEPKSEPKPILDFVDQTKDPNYYIDRYYNEAVYKEWFDANYPDYTIEEAVGLSTEEDMSDKCGPGTVFKDGACVLEKTGGGGCLIATAAFGSEMAPQVQYLREIRDNTVQNTLVGVSFMTGFNQFYYSFSPAIADLERENAAFKQVVKISIMPLLTTLSILNYVDIDSEESMLGYGIGIILLNLGIYFVMPAVVIQRTFRYYKSRK